jgi:hypothetical protein
MYALVSDAYATDSQRRDGVQIDGDLQLSVCSSISAAGISSTPAAPAAMTIDTPCRAFRTRLAFARRQRLQRASRDLGRYALADRVGSICASRGDADFGAFASQQLDRALSDRPGRSQDQGA